jgi:hypothetical protein
VYLQTSIQETNTEFNGNNSAVVGLLLADRHGRANGRIMQISVLIARKKKLLVNEEVPCSIPGKEAGYSNEVLVVSFGL